MPTVPLNVPNYGTGSTDMSLAAWLVDDGDDVSEGQEVVELETDKATGVVEASATGKIRLLKDPGVELAPGDVIAEIETA